MDEKIKLCQQEEDYRANAKVLLRVYAGVETWLDKNDKKAIRNALLSFFCCIVVAFRVDNDKITI